MSFGFGVGDFIAVGTLVRDIVGSLQDAGGSKSEYQEILRELESLRRVLIHLDTLQPQGQNPTTINAIKFTALSCRIPLEEFLSKIRRYDKTLGTWSKLGSVRSVKDKLKWSLTHKDEIVKLQLYLSVHVGMINVSLAQYGFEKMDIASQSSQKDHLHLLQELGNNTEAIQRIDRSTQAQTQALTAANSMFETLVQMVSGDVVASLVSLAGMVSKVYVSTQQIYTVVLDIKNSISTIDVRWTHFQAPLTVEDALGRKFFFDPMGGYDLLEITIKHKFAQGSGSSEVALGNFEMFNAKNNSQVMSRDAEMLPGTTIIMAILIERSDGSDQECPMPKCKSSQTAPVRGGGRKCCDCDVLFGLSEKTRNTLMSHNQPKDDVRSGKRKLSLEDDVEDDAHKRRKTSSGKFDVHSFRNVRLASVAAAEAGFLDVIQKLRDAKANVNAVSAKYKGRTALYVAAEAGHLNIVQMLLDAGADVNAVSAGYKGRTPLQVALEGHLDIL